MLDQQDVRKLGVAYFDAVKRVELCCFFYFSCRRNDSEHNEPPGIALSNYARLCRARLDGQRIGRCPPRATAR